MEKFDSKLKDAIEDVFGEKPNAKRSKKIKSADVTVPDKRVEFKIDRFLVVASEWRGEFVANAHAGQHRIAQITGNSLDGVVASMKDYLSERRQRLTESRKDGVPCTEEYEDALRSYLPRMEDRLRHALLLHAGFPKRTAHLQAIAGHLRITAEDVAQLYARLGRVLSRTLPFSPDVIDSLDRSISVVATPAYDTPAAQVWTLRPEFADAIGNVLRP